VILPSGHWQRPAVAALLAIPLVLVVALSAPAWLVLPFLSEPRRNTVLRFAGCLIDWVKAIQGSADPPGIHMERTEQNGLPDGRAGGRRDDRFDTACTRTHIRYGHEQPSQSCQDSQRPPIHSGRHRAINDHHAGEQFPAGFSRTSFKGTGSCT
jgi:hypothetical protein